MKAVFKNSNIAVSVIVLLAMLVLNIPGLAINEDAATLTVSSASIYRGETARISVSLSNIESMSAIQFFLRYDSGAFDVESKEKVIINEALSNASIEVSLQKEGDRGVIRVVGAKTDNYEVNTPIDVITFEITAKSDAEFGAYPITLYEDRIGATESGPPKQVVGVPSQVVSGSITINDDSEPTPSPTKKPSTGGGGEGATLDPVTGETPKPTETPTPTEKPKVLFSDVSGWAEEFIYYLAERGIVIGKSEGIFAPNDNVTRAEFVTMLARSVGEGTRSGTNTSFIDVSGSDWFAPYVAWAAQNQIVLGYEDGSFAPNKNITREELCTMIVRTLTAYDSAPEIAELFFADADLISDWAKSSIASLAEMGVVSGKGENRFYPKDLATRAETAKIIAGAFSDLIEEYVK